jgi:hypothetical protein
MFMKKADKGYKQKNDTNRRMLGESRLCSTGVKDSIRVDYVDKETFFNPDDFIVPIADNNTLELMRKASENIADFSMGEIVAAENRQDTGKVEWTVDSYPMTSPEEIRDKNEDYFEENSQDVDLIDLNVDPNIMISPEEMGDEAVNGPSSLASLPDLRVSSIASYGTYPFTALAPSQFSISIVNYGVAAATASIGAIFLDGQLVGTYNVPNLQPGYGYEPIFMLTNITAGSHTIKAQADYSGIIAESDETNNTVSKTFS